MMPAASCSTSASAPSATTPGAATQSSPPLNPHRVLLLLDVQTDTHSNISQILSAARAAHPPPLIIHVRNTGDPGDPDARTRPAGPHLVVAGFQTDYSVLLLIRGAHATFDRIEVLHGGGVTPAERIEDEIEAELEEAGVHLLDMKDLPGIFVDR
ncbi:hypothetical protein BD779DRAFT_1577048, partial [Infundibulicybe gibba]